MPVWTPRTPVSSSWGAQRDAAYLLNEDGSYLLNEDGTKILLQESEFVSTEWTPRVIPS